MDSISDLFDSYETDYLQLIESIKLKLKEDACQLQGGKVAVSASSDFLGPAALLHPLCATANSNL